MPIGSAAEQRFQEVYDTCAPQVFLYCRRRADAETARECASETFLTAWRRIDDVPNGDGALPWLYAVARKVLANQFRSQRRYRRLVTRLGLLRPDPSVGPELQVVRRMEDEQVLDAVSRLRSDDQELLYLAMWEELPHDMIGTILGCSAHTVAFHQLP